MMRCGEHFDKVNPGVTSSFGEIHAAFGPRFFSLRQAQTLAAVGARAVRAAQRDWAQRRPPQRVAPHWRRPPGAAATAQV